jgi:hypothetical protein
VNPSSTQPTATADTDHVRVDLKTVRSKSHMERATTRTCGQEGSSPTPHRMPRRPKTAAQGILGQSHALNASHAPPRLRPSVPIASIQPCRRHPSLRACARPATSPQQSSRQPLRTDRTVVALTHVVHTPAHAHVQHASREHPTHHLVPWTATHRKPEIRGSPPIHPPVLIPCHDQCFVIHHPSSFNTAPQPGFSRATGALQRHQG